MTQKKGPLTGTQRALTLAARGDCYNPECKEPLITCRNSIHIANFEFAHIKDESRPTSEQSDIGWRFWPDDLTQEERNHFDNIILLCKPCHKLIDKIRPKDFSIEILREWKKENEGDRGGELSKIGQTTPDQLESLILKLFTNSVDTSDDHEKAIFEKYDSTMSETQFLSLLDALSMHDGFPRDILNPILKFSFLFNEVSNQFVSSSLNTSLSDLQVSLDELVDFIGSEFFTIDKQIDNWRYLRPNLNMDRGGDGSYLQNQQYRALKAQLTLYVNKAYVSYTDFRALVKELLYI